MSQKRAAPVLSASGGETTMHFDSARSARINLTIDPSGGLTIDTTVDDATSVQEVAVIPPSPRLSPAQDRYQVLASWNATATAILWLCTHHVFEEQVAATPETPTASFEDTSQYVLHKEVEPANLVGIGHYHRRSQLHAERFPHSPFGLRETGLSMTGDEGRWREDGDIEVSGHSDCSIQAWIGQVGLERWITKNRLLTRTYAC